MQRLLRVVNRVGQGGDAMPFFVYAGKAGHTSMPPYGCMMLGCEDDAVV